MEILGPLHYITQHTADQGHFLKMKVQENSQLIVIILNIEICWKIFNTFCFWGRDMWSAATIYLYTANYICNDILNINITFLLFHRTDILYRIAIDTGLGMCFFPILINPFIVSLPHKQFLLLNYWFRINIWHFQIWIILLFSNLNIFLSM